MFALFFVDVSIFARPTFNTLGTGPHIIRGKNYAQVTGSCIYIYIYVLN